MSTFPRAIVPFLALFLGQSAVADARVRTARRDRLVMNTAPLLPVWVSQTDTLEEAADAPADGPEPTATGEQPRAVHGEATREACLSELRKLGIPHRAAPARGGIWVPVEITGPIQGITYQALYTRAPPLVDCPFAITLHLMAGVYRRFGVTTIHYTSTYRPPPKQRGRTGGHHPMGMAIDVNEVTFKDGRRLVVLTDWEKAYGGPGNCVGVVKRPEAALLRRIVCALEEAHVVRRIITPDADLPHRNHWHISGATLGEAFTRGRWCGRTLDQPLPGDRGFDAYYAWYACWKHASTRKRYRCYRQRAGRKPRPPVRFTTPRETPRVAVWLSTQVAADRGEAPPEAARSVPLVDPPVQPRRP